MTARTAATAVGRSLALLFLLSAFTSLLAVVTSQYRGPYVGPYLFAAIISAAANFFWARLLWTRAQSFADSPNALVQHRRMNPWILLRIAVVGVSLLLLLYELGSLSNGLWTKTPYLGFASDTRIRGFSPGSYGVAFIAIVVLAVLAKLNVRRPVSIARLISYPRSEPNPDEE